MSGLTSNAPLYNFYGTAQTQNLRARRGFEPLPLITLVLGLLMTTLSGCGDFPPEDEVSQSTTSATELKSALTPQRTIELDHRRSLIETNVALLEPITMEFVLTKIAENANLAVFPAFTHNVLFDLYNSDAESVFPMFPAQVPHHNCGSTEALQNTNSFPMACDRAEGGLAETSIGESEEMENWEAIALVNRIDLAPEDGAHCGEQRLIMARNSGPGRVFVIFEAQIPNPAPDAGICSCYPISRFWAGLTGVDDPEIRHNRLMKAFFTGHTRLQGLGFGPFMSAENFSAGTGQIRTNNFEQRPWTLREVKLVSWLGFPLPLTVPVASNLHAPLLRDDSEHPRAAACKDSFLAGLSSLLSDDPNIMALDVDPRCWDAESPNDGFQGNYTTQIDQDDSPDFFAEVQAELDTLDSDLSPADIAARATFSGSCIGCHQEAVNVSLGAGVNAPGSLGFVHVSELAFHQEDCGDEELCFGISDGLKDTFLPHRDGAMGTIMAKCAPKVRPRRIPNVRRLEDKARILDISAGSGRLDGKVVSEILRVIADDKKNVRTIGGQPAARAH